jgi:hypothetical protein
LTLEKGRTTTTLKSEVSKGRESLFTVEVIWRKWLAFVLSKIVVDFWRDFEK